MAIFPAVLFTSMICLCSSFFLPSGTMSKISRPSSSGWHRSRINSIGEEISITNSRFLLQAVAKKAESDSDGVKKPKAAKKIKEDTDQKTDGEIKKVKKIVKEKVVKADADPSVVKPVKKTKTVKAVDTAAPTAKSPKAASKASVTSSSAADKMSNGDFEGNDMFDLKELLGDDFLSEGEGMGLLPNLDDDLAKLEANLSELGDFGFDFRDDDDDDEALRSIESGKFDIDEFLKEGADDLDDILSALPTLTKKGAEYGASPAPARSKKAAESSNKKKDKAVQPTLQQAMKGVQEDDDDDEGMEDEESVSDQVLEELALSLGLGGDDLIDVDFDAEDEGDDDDLMPTKALMKKGLDGDGTGKDGIQGLDGMQDKDKLSAMPLIIDGLEVDRDGFELGLEPPPLEEFKRLMESLGPDSMFVDDYAESLAADEYVQPEPIPIKTFKEPSDKTKAWLPLVYEGGKSNRIVSKPEIAKSLDWWLIDHEGAAPADWRVQVISVVTNSSNVNTTALDMVNMVYDHIQKWLTPEEKERINFQILCYEQENGEPMEELEDSIQMWLESYNTYHLVDGAAMKEAWGSIMPHIMLAEKNLDAILNQVRWALAEDTFEGALLTPRLRRLRFRGGAQEMTTGFNTEQLDSEFSVVSVR